MSYEVKMPQLGMNQDTAVVVAWFKKEGEKVEKGDPLFEVETDKDTMEVEAQKEGYLSKIRVDEGSEVPVGHLLALISDNNEGSDTAQTDLAVSDPLEPSEPEVETVKDKSTIIEVQNKILPNEDHEISEFVLKSFKNRGIDIHINCELLSVDIKNSSVECEIKIGNKKNKLSADKLLLSVGIKPNIEDLGLEELNIDMEKGFIKTNELMKTSENGIYAIGDVTDGPWLAHKASHEGILCVDAIKGLKTHKIQKENIPGCTYSRPQIASIGLTEKRALELNHEIKVGKFPFIGNGKAIALGEPEGFIKTIFDKKTGEFLGAHLVGPEVTELIQGFAIAKKLETTEEDLMETIFPHPTLSEAMHESVLDAYDRVIHF